jgi:myo-inositol-1(or 4)-monophosphatase
MDYKTVLETATDIAHQAGAMVREAFPKTAISRVNFKGEVNPVTETDTAVEELIIARLRSTFPDHRILAEEGGGDDWRAPGQPIWLIDPLDGTVNFAHGFPAVSVSLALLVKGQPAVGVAHDPLRGETFVAISGGGATLDGQPIHVSSVERLEDAFLATGFPYNRRTAPDNNTERLDHFLRRSLGVRRAGSAVLDMAYVACGRFDGFWEIGLHPWDVAAAVLLVREAGGKATDFEGNPDCISGEFIVASNGLIHDQMLRVVKEGAAAPRPSPVKS